MSYDPGRPVLGRYVDVAGPVGASRRGSVLYDPYARGPAPPSERRKREPRQRWLALLTALGFCSLLASSAIFAWGVHHWRELMADKPLAEPQRPQGVKGAAHPGDDAPKADPAPAAAEPAVPAPKVPEATQSTQIGAIEVVDIGLSSAPLKEALFAQVKLARAKGQTLLLMVTGTDCTPCRGLDRSLIDPQMQAALRNVRLVRVDLRVFKEELSALKIQTNVYPVFALLAPDLTPKDAIHGGEWDDDVAANIAPVLRDFVRGRYTKRRHPEWTPTTGGTQL